MAKDIAHRKERTEADTVIRRLAGLVTCGPRDLDIAWAMSGQGYDAVKWAEGQAMVAELLSFDLLPESSLDAAMTWYEEAATAARQALASQPQLLAKLGVPPAGCT